MRTHRTIVALVYSQVYHIAEDGATLCGISTRDPWSAANSRYEWLMFSEPPPDLRECKRCGASPRRLIGQGSGEGVKVRRKDADQSRDE